MKVASVLLFAALGCACELWSASEAEAQDKPPAASGGKKERKSPAPAGTPAPKPKGKKSDRSGPPTAGEGKAKAELARPSAPPQRAQPAAAGQRPQPAALDDEDVRKEGGTEIKSVEFGGLDIEGQLKTPQMLYFLNRLRAEFDRPRLPHRSFMPELSRSTKEKDF